MPRADGPPEPKADAPTEPKAAAPAESKREPRRAPAARPETHSSESGGGAGPEAVEHMVRNYAGVGKRTAEALVEHFGAGVFDVIDREPKRLTEVLSEGRAKAVVAAREQERA